VRWRKEWLVEEVRQSLPCNSSTSDEALHVGTADEIMALARQKYWQIRTSFTPLLLYDYNLNSGYKDYSQNLLASLTYLGVL
jgi:hypothetical protein